LLELLQYLRIYRFTILCVVLFTFIQAISELLLPTLMADIVDVGIINGDILYILKVGGIMVLTSIISMASIIIASYLSSKVASGYSRILREEIFTKVESFSLSEFNKIGTASLITRSTNDITQIERVTIMGLRMMLRAPMLFVGGIIMAITRNARLSLLLVIIIPVLFLIIVLVSKKAMPLFKMMQKKVDNLNRVVRENLTGVRVIRAFNRIEYESKRFNRANMELRDTAILVNRLMSTLMPIMMIIMNLSTVAIVWFGGLRINHGSMQIGDLMAFIQYMMQILFSLMMLSMIFVMLPRASASADRINEVLELFSSIKDMDETKNISHDKGRIEFRNVSFNYEGAEKPALENISFWANPGEITAIIGGTGSGKSTLVKLILRFYDINKGHIFINGVDIRQLSQKELRAMIGYVPQKVSLFSGSISENIRYGKEDASDREVIHAAKIAQAYGFIQDLEKGFDSIVSQGGTNLSGGQKQRLSIARALVRKPQIYLFDDCFSALDFKTDTKLRMGLSQKLKGATTIIVAQRISTIVHADQIIVLDEGKIVGRGKHGELLKTCEVYREIVSSQMGEEGWYGSEQ